MITYRAYRGGGWCGDDTSYLAARARFKGAPLYRTYYIGLRCARKPEMNLRPALRGGRGWYDVVTDSRAAYRDFDEPDNRHNIGLRCMRAV